ncbi:MAG: chorismate mutase [Clostridia bacterium]|nr:chorismate mutase [Clostridia bacterium]
MMHSLENAREKIDRADREMARLFQERMRAVNEIARYKAENGLPVFDPEREAQVIKKNAALIEDKDIGAYYISYLRSVIDISKKYQSALLEGMRIAFCGVEGAFANIAAKRIFPMGRLVSYNDFTAAYTAVQNGECDCCVLPIENSTAGEVGQVTDLMFSGSLYINGVYSLPIRHHLLGVNNARLSDIKKVISHPQALMQCGEYISAHGFSAENAENTAIAAQKTARLNDTSVAAIASRETAELYGLQILDHDINEQSANTTRFAVFSRSVNENVTADNSFILLFTVNNRVGALAKAVNIISAHGFDMRVLRSRPVKDVPWQYYFYVEAKGDQGSDEGVRMRRELAVCCETLKIVGHYPEEIDLSR